MRINEIATLLNTMSPEVREATMDTFKRMVLGDIEGSKVLAASTAELQKTFLETEIPEKKAIGPNPSPGKGPLANRPKPKKNKGEDDSVSVDVKGPSDA